MSYNNQKGVFESPIMGLFEVFVIVIEEKKLKAVLLFEIKIDPIFGCGK